MIDKPPGISMHDHDSIEGIEIEGIEIEGKGIEGKVIEGMGIEGMGIVSLLRKFTDDQALFPCHRLDTETSGLLIFGKGKDNTRKLSELFAKREIQKYYLALSARKPSKKQGSIVGDMSPARNGNWKLLKSRTNPVVTQFFSAGLEGIRAFVIKPLTGKTHQIRVALRSISAPVLGDTRYSDIKIDTEKFRLSLETVAVARKAETEGLELAAGKPDRMYLHAYRLEFTLDNIHYSIEQAPSVGTLFQQSQFTHWLQAQGDVSQLPWPSKR